MRIAFFGPPRSGKTTMATIMAKNSAGVKLSFADELRKEVSAKKMIPMYELTTPPFKYQYIHLLQQHGGEMRAKDPDYWLRPIEDEIIASGNKEVATNTSVPLFIDDMRLDNEFDLLAYYGFTMIELVGDPNSQDSRNMEDESELDWPHWFGDKILMWTQTVEHRVTILEEMLR